MQKNQEQRIFIVEQYLLTGSRISVRRAFAIKFREYIDVKTVDRVMEKWRRKGSILNQNKGNSGPKRSVRTDENITSVEARIQESSQSVRKIAAELGINRESVRRILKKDLGLKSYKLQTSQQLSAGDRERRLEFCNRMKRMVEQREIDINKIIFSDESHIYLKGFMNKQNFRKWSPTKPEEVYEKPLHSPKVTVWCGLSSNRIYGPYFFEDPEGNARTVTSETYIEMLNMIFVNDIYPDQWFQQDGATAHTSLRAREWLTNQFGNKIISHHMEFPWPARSPDLSPLDYFLWGYVKENVFKRQPADIEILKEIVQGVVSSIDQDVLRAVMANFEKRINLCIEQQGGHFEHLL